MAKVLFINPTVREEDVPRHVPYGIALLAAIAMERGHQVQVYDENAWRLGPEARKDVLEADDWEDHVSLERSPPQQQRYSVPMRASGLTT